MGATGTGKSALALELAQRMQAVIINADAMQMVRELSIITARPSEAEMVTAEHALYGVLPAHEPTSVALWLELACCAVRDAWRENRMPIIVGGTGMYIQAMMQGLAKVPEIPGEIREPLRTQTATQLYEALKEKDPLMASRLKPGDTQRIARALEVIEATGVSLAEWQEQVTKPPFPDAVFHWFAIDMPREQLYARLDARFLQMMGKGALEEVIALRKLNLPADMPILHAHGVPELTAHLEGITTLEEAVAKAQQLTRNYAKRQVTWIRNQFTGTLIPAGDAKAQAADIINLIKKVSPSPSKA